MKKFKALKLSVFLLCFVLLIPSAIYAKGDSIYTNEKENKHHRFTLENKLELFKEEYPFDTDAIKSGNLNYFGIKDVSKSDASSLLNLSFEDDLNGEQAKVTGEVIVNNDEGESYIIKVDGTVSKYLYNDKVYYFGPTIINFDHKGNGVSGTVGIFHNKTDETTNLSIWIGEIGHKEGSSLLNYGEVIYEQHEVVQSYHSSLDEKNKLYSEQMQFDHERLVNPSEVLKNSTLNTTNTSDYFRNALNIGTSYVTNVNEGYASRWIANQHIYVNDAKSRGQFISTLLWKDKLYTNNDSILSYMSNSNNSSFTKYLTVHNYAVQVTLGGLSSNDTTTRISDTNPTQNNKTLPVAWKMVKLNATGVISIAYNIFASTWNASLDQVSGNSSYRSFTNTLSAGENTAIDHIPGNATSFPNPTTSNDYGMSHEVVIYAPNASSTNKIAPTISSNTNVVWLFSMSNGYTGYPMANLSGSLSLYTNP